MLYAFEYGCRGGGACPNGSGTGAPSARGSAARPATESSNGYSTGLGRNGSSAPTCRGWTVPQPRRITSAKAHPYEAGARRSRGPQAIGRSSGGSTNQDPHGPRRRPHRHHARYIPRSVPLLTACAAAPQKLGPRRNEVERLVRRLKGYRRVFTHYDKLDVIFLASITVAVIHDILRSVNTPYMPNSKSPSPVGRRTSTLPADLDRSIPSENEKNRPGGRTVRRQGACPYLHHSVGRGALCQTAWRRPRQMIPRTVQPTSSQDRRCLRLPTTTYHAGDTDNSRLRRDSPSSPDGEENEALRFRPWRGFARRCGDPGR